LVETTVCPRRILEETDAEEVLHWWLSSSQFDGMTRSAVGPPEWPRPGGMLNQDAKLVEAVHMLRYEWDRWTLAARKKSDADKRESASMKR
jgi:hypothetical protein